MKTDPFRAPSDDFKMLDSYCIIGEGILDLLSNDEESKKIAEIYEKAEKVSYDTEQVIREWRSGRVEESN